MVLEYIMISKVCIAIISLLLVACSAKFVPVGLDLTGRNGATNPGFVNLLVEHMATRMDIPFARALVQGRYQYEGTVTTPDERTFAYVFRALEVRYAPFSFIYLKFDSDPYFVAWQNTSALERSEGVTQEEDMTFNGTYKLALKGATFCIGDAWERPVLTGEDIKIIPAVKGELRKHLKEMFLEYYTMPLCMGTKTEEALGELPENLEGVRFYFDGPDAMNAFARSMISGYPMIKIGDRSSPPGPNPQSPSPLKAVAPFLLRNIWGPGAAEPER